MRRVGKWLLVAILLLVVVAAVGLFTLQRWLGTDDFRSRVQAQSSSALGVPVSFDRVEVDPWPVPAVALSGIRIQTRPPLLADRLELRWVLRALAAGRLELATVLVRKADLPQSGIDQLLASLKKKETSAPPTPPKESSSASADWIPRRVVLDAVTWSNMSGTATTVDADLRLNASGMPEEASVKMLKGQFQGAKAQLMRTALAWDVKVDHAQGTIQGMVDLQSAVATGKEIVLSGQLETKGLQIAALSGTVGAGGPLSGRLDATTSLSARAASIGLLMDNLQTQSRFTVHDAVVHGIDLARAVRTVGLSRGGETRLDTLSGNLNTRGKAVALNNLAASSGALSASGNVAMAANRSLSGRVQVSLGATALGDVVGVPLLVSGTLDAPEVTLTRAAMLGAAIGTVVLPGIGTGAGASLGDKLGGKLKGLFGK